MRLMLRKGFDGAGMKFALGEYLCIKLRVKTLS